MGIGSFATEGQYGGKRKIRDVDIESGVRIRAGSEGTEMHNLAPIDIAEGSYESNAALR
jgi:hypothetical protein